jgi:hypothetical protein
MISGRKASPGGKKGMDPKKNTEALLPDPKTWVVLESLIDPDPGTREQALADLARVEGFQDQPVLMYLLTTRVLDPDLEVRYYAIQILGEVLGSAVPGGDLSVRSLKTLTDFTTRLDKSQLVMILEVADRYLAAEESIIRILKLCSYAGNVLDGIVNDRKLPVEIRQQAISFCGDVGFLSTATAIRNLIQRIERERDRTGQVLRRKKYLDEEKLFPYAVTALAKLESS